MFSGCTVFVTAPKIVSWVDNLANPKERLPKMCDEILFCRVLKKINLDVGTIKLKTSWD